MGYFPSIKLGRMIAFESLVERDYLYLLDYAPEVEWFEEQPLTIPYAYEDPLLHYTPDFHLIETGQDVLVECKPDALVDTEGNQRKFRVAQAWCAERDWQFRVVTDQQLRAGFRLRNIQMLTRYARYSVPPTTKGSLYARLCATRSAVPIQELVASMPNADSGAVTAAILCLAFHQELVLSVDDAPISGDTWVCLPSAQPKEVRP
jgi:hypothetical protein